MFLSLRNHVQARLTSHLDPPSTTTVPPPALAQSLLHPQPVTTHPPPLPTHRHTQVRIPRPRCNGHIIPFHFSHNILQYLDSNVDRSSSTPAAPPYPAPPPAFPPDTIPPPPQPTTATTSRTPTHRSAGQSAYYRHPPDRSPRGCCSGYKYAGRQQTLMGLYHYPNRFTKTKLLAAITKHAGPIYHSAFYKQLHMIVATRFQFYPLL